MGETAKFPSAKIAPSMLSSDFANLALEAKHMLDCGADWLHMDIMDGHFVPNLTIGAPVIQSLRKHTDAYLDCHLMVTNPSDYVTPLAKAGASGFTFHIEVVKDGWKDIIKSIKSSGMQAGVALRPGTSVEEIFPLVNILRKKFPWLNIEVDGGLGPATIEEAAKAGANCIVAGSSVFGSKDPAGVISILRCKVEEAAIRGF